jgi:hypothetical protein
MQVHFPTISGPMGVALDTIRRALLGVITTQEAAPFVLLRAPNGRTWKIEVSDSGVVTTTQL